MATQAAAIDPARVRVRWLLHAITLRKRPRCAPRRRTSPTPGGPQRLRLRCLRHAVELTRVPRLVRAPPALRRTARSVRPPVVEAFGLSIASDHPFRFHHARGRGRPDLTFEVVDTPPL